MAHVKLEKMIWSIAIFAATLIGKLVYDRHLHFSGKTIHHVWGAVIVCICLIGASGLYYFKSMSLEFSAFLLVVMLLNFWMLFDSLFGILIARDPLFLGTSSWLDRLQIKYPTLQVAKYVLAIVSIILFICVK